MKITKDKVIFLIVVIVIVTITSAVSTYATNYLFNSNEVSYNNTSSGLTSTDVQGAIDELYTKASKWLNPNDMGTPKYYAFGLYRGWCGFSNTDCKSYANFPTTSTTPPSGKNVYEAKYADGGYGICIKRNGKEHCFRGRNYKAEVKHLQEVLSGVSCKANSNFFYCSASGISCYIYSHGGVQCDDRGTTGNHCQLDMIGSMNCY